MSSRLTRDRLTWVAYALLGWFAFLQAAPGQVVPHLRDELGLSYAVGGLHVAAFAGGSVLSGLLFSRWETRLGRREVLWGGATVLGVGTAGLTVGTAVPVTVGSILVMGFGGGLVLAAVQALLADHHGELRTVALTEANVAASVSYVVLIGAFSLTAVLHLGWRAALWSSLLVPLALGAAHRRLPVDSPHATDEVDGQRLPAVFWVAAGVLMCASAAEWCVNSWAATFLGDGVGLSTDAAVSLMAAYFSGVVAGRIVGSRLAHRYAPSRLLASALAIALAGFAVLWISTAPVPAALGLAVLGLGLGNTFPMGLALALSLAPDRSGVASARVVTLTSLAVLLAPLSVGTLADATSLKAALTVVPALMALAALGLLAVRRHQPTAMGSLAAQS